ncbi:MAG: peptide chain release factor N(5)-glutamine methyltransferase [Pyrinomonadaceae bacterium]
MRQVISHAQEEASKILNENGISDARRDANLLLAFALERDLTYLIAHNDELMSFQENQKFYSFVARRATGEPLQYILGKQEFYGLEFEVNQAVLIPRPETELLVEAALEILCKKDHQTFCDVGTGSGCVAVAIAKNAPSANGFALDISTNALTTARRNADINGVNEQIQFLESDIFTAFQSLKSEVQNPKFTVVVSNPPYIPQNELPNLQREVRDFEPHSALFSGTDGLSFIKILLAEAGHFLNKKGFLLFEIGFGQSDQIKTIINESVWNLQEIRLDFQDIPRVVVLEKKC